MSRRGQLRHTALTGRVAPPEVVKYREGIHGKHTVYIQRLKQKLLGTETV